MKGHAEECRERYCNTLHWRSPDATGRLWEDRGARCCLCSESFKIACAWQDSADQIYLWSVFTLARSVTKWNKACTKRWLRLINFIKRTTNCRQFSGKHNWRLQTWFVPRCFICRWLARLQINVWKVYCAHLDQIRLFQVHGRARSNLQFLTPVRFWNYFAWRRFTYGWFTRLGTACWKHCLVKQSRETSSVLKRERVFPSHSHFDTCVFESFDHVPANIPNSSHSTQLYLFEDNLALILMIHEGRSPNLRARQIAQSWLGLAFWENELWPFLFW